MSAPAATAISGNLQTKIRNTLDAREKLQTALSLLQNDRLEPASAW